MLTILSPAKKLDFETGSTAQLHTFPDWLDRSQQLINKLKRISIPELRKLMGLSENLAQLNANRYANWTVNFGKATSKQAILAFKGDVYQGMKNETLSKTDLNFAQEHLRILSGLHGLLRPLDLILPYRLEMGTRLAMRGKKNLYQFWGDSIVESLNIQLKKLGSDVLINLASSEYSKAVNLDKCEGKLITPVFKDLKNGELKIRSLYAKQARGMMAGYILRQQITEPQDLKQFTEGGYRFTEKLSDNETWIFTR